MSTIPFTGRTRISLLIGTPIVQVLAPGRLTQMMQADCYDGILVPFEVPRDAIGTMLPALQMAPNVEAILVTLPHKFPCAQACDTLDDAARQLGAVNAMRRRPGGGWHGANFDGAGMVRAILAAGGTLAGARAHMAGAGAAGTSIAIALLAAGVRELTFHDLSAEAEQRLLVLLERHYPGRARIAAASEAANAEVIVNASCCGLKPDDPLPVPAPALAGARVVADVVTDPLCTPLLNAAAAQGALCVTGGDMLDGQLRLLFDFIRGDDAAG